jgi:hypothetical protein
MKAGAAIRQELETERKRRINTARYSFFNEILQGLKADSEGNLGTNLKTKSCLHAQDRTGYPTDLVLV